MTDAALVWFVLLFTAAFGAVLLVLRKGRRATSFDLHSAKPGTVSQQLPAPAPTPEQAAATTLLSLLSSSEPSWLRNMPPRVLAIDVETTGLTENDRVVSVGMLLLDTRSLLTGHVEMKINHLIFDPTRRNHPSAERVHGYSNSLLSRQEVFAEETSPICEMIDATDLVVAHNADFDMSFLNRELVTAGRMPIAKPSYCTMTQWRERGLPGHASLEAVATYLGLARSSRTHNALEDAWLALRIYLLLCGCPIGFEFTAIAALASSPLNLHPVSPDDIPSSERHLADVMAEAKRSGDYAPAERFLTERIARAEMVARHSRTSVPYRTYRTLASVCRRQRRYVAEVEVLMRYCALQRECGHAPNAEVVNRLERARCLAARAAELGLTPPQPCGAFPPLSISTGERAKSSDPDEGRRCRLVGS